MCLDANTEVPKQPPYQNAKHQPIPHFKILLDINFHWNRRPLTIWRFCWHPFWKWWPRKNDPECKFHHYQSIPHFKILLDINVHWIRRPLTICRSCWWPFWKRCHRKIDPECNFHHYQSIPHFKITLDINFHWNQRTLKFCRFCRRPLARDFFFVQNILPTLLNKYAKFCGNPFGGFRYKRGQIFWHTFTVSMSTEAILKIPRPECTSWDGDPASCEV